MYKIQPQTNCVAT